MRVTPMGWKPVHAGWGLISSVTGSPIDPMQLVTDAPIEMTDWEIHDFAVEVVRKSLESEGKNVMSSHGSPHVTPSIGFVGDSGLEWIVVRAARYPERHAMRPDNWERISQSCSALSTLGHFASVAVASAEQASDEAQAVAPLLRGHGMHVRYEGLTE
jgi:hypothetical protein